MVKNGASADVILAECNGQAWLVLGEQHIDDLLNNTLSAHVSIDIIACESKSAVDALWRRHGGGDNTAMMWMIHPAILRRARGQSQGLPGEVIVAFAAWSAALDDAAQTALRTAADLALNRPEAALALVRHVPQDAPPMAAQMADLRSGLVEAHLAGMGVAAERLLRETMTVASPELADRITLVLRLT